MIFRLILAIVLKIFLIYTCYKAAKRFYHSRLEAGIVAYLISHVMQNTILLILSPFHWVTATGIAVGYLVFGSVLILWEVLYSKKHGSPDPFQKAERLNCSGTIVVLLTSILFIAFIVRPFFYFDTTDDALIQGMPKLAFIEQHRSLFVHYDSLTINTFSNEWLGEMNGLFYMLIVGQEFAVGFGNAEIFVFLAFATLYCVSAYGYRGKYRYIIAFTVFTLPVILGLVMTIKTDLFSIILLPLTVAFLLHYYKEEQPEYLFASILCIGATAASKISVVPGAGLLLIALVLFYFLKGKKPVLPVVYSTVMAGILCNRYVINLFQYGNPVQRALNEKMQISSTNLKNSLLGCWGEFFEVKELIQTLKPWSSSNWVLTKGLGYFGLACLLVLIGSLVVRLLQYKSCKLNRVNLLCIVLPILLGFLFFCCSSIWYDWSFRYVVPYVLVAFFAAIAFLGRVEEQYDGNQKKFKRVLCTIIATVFLILGSANSMSVFRYGQAIPYIPSSAKNMSLTQKKLVYSSLPKYADLSQHREVIDVLENGGKCLLFDTFSYAYYHWFGDGHCVEVDLAYDEADLITQAFDEDYDIYVIATTLEDAKNYPNARAFFAAHGYKCLETTSGLIFIK